MNRGVCRHCGQSRPDKSKNAAKIQTVKTSKFGSPSNAKPSALAPWATPEMVQEREVQLEKAISAAKCSGGCEQVVEKLERELELQRKKAAELVSVLSQVESTKTFLARADKRQSDLGDQIENLRTEKTKMDQEITEAKERLGKLEVDAAKMLHSRAPNFEDSAVSNLLQNCVDLLQKIESASTLAQGSTSSLPPQVLEAMRNMHAVVESIRPLPQPSKHTALQPEDAVIIGDAMDEDGLMTELTAEDSDVKLLEIAKRLKAKRLRVN